MRPKLTRFTPVEVIVDLFLLCALFVAMAAAFIIVLQTYNAGQGDGLERPALGSYFFNSND